MSSSNGGGMFIVPLPCASPWKRHFAYLPVWAWKPIKGKKFDFLDYSPEHRLLVLTWWRWYEAADFWYENEDGKEMHKQRFKRQCLDVWNGFGNK